VENQGCSKGASVELQECNVIDSLGSFTELIIAPTYDGGVGPEISCTGEPTGHRVSQPVTGVFAHYG